MNIMVSSLLRGWILNNSLSFLKNCTRKKHRYPQKVRDLLDYSKVPKLDFEGPEKKDIKETFLKGSGPGGQSVAKSCNAVCLSHIPTGVTIKVHESRSLDRNRKIARERLLVALDKALNGDDSLEAQAKRISAKLSERDRISAAKKREGNIFKRLQKKEQYIAERIGFIELYPDHYLDALTKKAELEETLAVVRGKLSIIDRQKDEDIID